MLVRLRRLVGFRPLHRHLNTTSVRRLEGAYEGDGKTTMSVLNKNRQKLMIDTYAREGFRLNNGFFVFGPMVLIARAIFSWNVKSTSELNEESFTLFKCLEPAPELLVLGLEAPPENRQLIESLMKKMRVEILPTPQAVSTYNFLVDDNRAVAGAFIPPLHVELTHDETFPLDPDKAFLNPTRKIGFWEKIYINKDEKGGLPPHWQ